MGCGHHLCCPWAVTEISYSKKRTVELGIYGSAFVRFLYGLPLFFLLLFFIVGWPRLLDVEIDAAFVFWISLASCVQILFFYFTRFGIREP